MLDFYNSNDEFKQFVDKYCIDRGITKEVAFTHALVIATAEYYKSQERKK